MIGIDKLEDGWNIFYFVSVKEQEHRTLFLKKENGKLIGKSMFSLNEQGWHEILFKGFKELNVENWLPHEDDIRQALKDYPFKEELMSWFNLKTWLLSEHLTPESDHVSTLTENQARIPNVGIIEFKE